jgi:hypothetical protein
MPGDGEKNEESSFYFVLLAAVGEEYASLAFVCYAPSSGIRMAAGSVDGRKRFFFIFG